jgi:hypothetical protein
MSSVQATSSRSDVEAMTGGLILVKGIAGLGNRMLAFLTASLFAVATGRRLIVDWRDPIYTGRGGMAPDLFSDLFVSPLVDQLPERIEARTAVPALWQGRLDETLAVVGRSHDPKFFKRFGSFRHLAVDLRQIDFAQDVLPVFWSWREVLRPLRPYLSRIDARFPQMSDWEILREAGRRYLQPCERIHAAVERFIAGHFTRRMLGLHIRATDALAPVGKLIRTAKRLVRQQQCDGVFLATDNIQMEERMRRTLPNVVTLPKEMPREVVPLHYDPACKDRVERATQALMDILLLSRCQCLSYSSRSSFGYVASIWAPSGQIAVDVDRFHPIIRAKKLVQSWIY